MPLKDNAAIEITGFRMGPRVSPGLVKRPARPMGARRSGTRLSRPADRRRTARPVIEQDQPFNQVPLPARRQGPDLRERRDPSVYRRAERIPAPARTKGPLPSDPVDLCRG